jgi:hypothetical protein
VPLKYFVAQVTESIVDALGMVSRVAVPDTFVEARDVSGRPPDADIVIDFEPSELWLTATVFSTTFTQALSVMVMVLVALAFVPLIVIENVPVPDVVYPVLFLL